MPISPMFPQFLGFFQTLHSKVSDYNSFFVLTLHPILSFNPSIIRASIKACNNHESSNTPEKLHYFFSPPLSKFSLTISNFAYPLLFSSLLFSNITKFLHDYIFNPHFSFHLTCLVCFWREILLVKPTLYINFQHHY